MKDDIGAVIDGPYKVATSTKGVIDLLFLD